MSGTTHDFRDGYGPVPAHRHANPDGTVGGWIADTAAVAGTATIDPDAQVGGSAWVGGPRHVLTVGPVGSEHRSVTAWRTDTGHQIKAGCWTGTVDELAARIAPGGDHGWDSAEEARWRADYTAVVALVRLRVAEWDAERAPAEAVAS